MCPMSERARQLLRVHSRLLVGSESRSAAEDLRASFCERTMNLFINLVGVMSQT